MPVGIRELLHGAELPALLDADAPLVDLYWQAHRDGVMRAAGVAEQDVSGHHRFFSRGVWDLQQVGLVVLQLALRLVPSEEPIAMTLDDTLARHTARTGGLRLAQQ